MIAPDRDLIGIDSIEAMAAMGFDYIELSLTHLTALSEAAFDELLARVTRSGLRCEACNNFFPPRLRLTGAEADVSAALEHATLAIARAGQLNVAVIVLGSSGAKNVPAGFPLAEARRQFVELLRQLGPIAERQGLTIVVEPISRPEANFVNLAAEGLALVREVDHPAIRLLVDYYHLATESESPAVVRDAGGAVRHVHFALPADRGFPTRWEQQFDPFFEALADIHYTGRLSIEAFTSDFATDGPRALATVRAALSRFEL